MWLKADYSVGPEVCILLPTYFLTQAYKVCPFSLKMLKAIIISRLTETEIYNAIIYLECQRTR